MEKDYLNQACLKSSQIFYFNFENTTKGIVITLNTVNILPLGIFTLR